MIGPVQMPDLILAIDSNTRFSTALLGREADDAAELTSLYAALLARGTEIDVKAAAAMIPGVAVAQVSAAMRLLETPGRLREANDAVVALQQSMPVVKLRIADQPIVLMTREGAPAVEGIEQYNGSSEERVKVQLLVVDAHGYTYPAMALTKLLRFDL